LVEPTVRSRKLGGELRRRREALGLRLDDVHAQTGLPTAKLSRIEQGSHGVRPEELERLLDVYDETADENRAVLLMLAKDSRRRGWWQTYRDVISPAYADLISLETDAESMRTFQSSLVPGLLQTAEYARATIAAINMTSTAAEVNALVEVRMARQAVLSRPNPIELWAVIHEGALRSGSASGAAMMREQLQRLLERQGLPNISLQVLPRDAPPHVGMSGSFAVIGFPAQAELDVVLVESLTSALYVEDVAEVRRYGMAFERLRAEALPFDKSADLIRTILKDSP
jgi:transcriptional regulator with XRE-family HTH domain